MTRKMYDSITAGDLPLDGELVAGYIDGGYRWSDQDWARFPDKVKVRIATRAATNEGHVLDVEEGDATPGEAPDWAARRRRAGVEPTIYCNLSNFAAVIDAFTAANEPAPQIWLAHYDAIAILPVKCVAKQYADEAMTGGHYDESVVADFWPGVDTMDKATYARDLEELVKGTIRVMAQTDPATIAAIEKAASDDTAVRVIGTKLAVVQQGALAEK